MATPQPKADDSRSALLERCTDLMDHVKLMRDYANTPGNVWLARGELNRIQELTVEIEKLLEEIKRGD